jgi:hypothetical protein
MAGLYTALSPGACVVATLKEGEDDDDVKLEKMQYMSGSIAQIEPDDCKSDLRFLGYYSQSPAVVDHL